MKTLLLTSDDVRAIAVDAGLDRLMDETIAALAAALADFDSGRYLTPVRDGFDYQVPAPGLLEWMPVLHRGRNAAVKMVGYHPRNPASLGLPTIISTMLSFDVDSGHLGTIVDATFSTALRTGAASAIASRLLAAEDARVLGLIGCGAQAVTQLHAMTRCFAIDTVLACDVDAAAVDSLRRRAASFGLADTIDIVRTTAERALADSDILCTQTSVGVGAGPVVADGAVRPHLHVNAVGSDFPGKTELPTALLGRALVVPDFEPQARREGESQLLAADAIGPSLDVLVRDPARAAAARGSLTVFDSTGWALEDLVTIELLCAHARRLGLGREVALETLADDPANPYEGMGGPAPTAAMPRRRAAS